MILRVWNIRIFLMERKKNNMNDVIKEDLKTILTENIEWEKLKNKVVLITGASGMIGSYLVRTLLMLNEIKNYNISVIALVRNLEKVPEDIRKNEKVTFIVGDVSVPVNIEEKIDFVIHAASPASPDIMKKHPISVMSANVLGTYNTLNLASLNRECKYMFVSSREAYGNPVTEKCVFTEDTYGILDPVNPRSCYSEGKRAAETYCATYKEEKGLDVKIVRPAYVYGPGMSLNDSRVQACFLRDVIQDRNICLNSDGSAIRSYIYIADVISGMFYVLLNSEDVVYNIADESCIISIKELAQTIIAASGKKLELEFNISNKNTGCSNLAYGVLGTKKINELGWYPKFDLMNGFKRTIKYFELEMENDL